MAEKLARSRQYEYRANSNLVLSQTDRDRNRENEPTGEPETLAGKLSGKFGDRAVVRTKDKDFDEKVEKMRKKQQQKVEEAKVKKRKRESHEASSVLAASFEVTGGYRPKTKETRA